MAAAEVFANQAQTTVTSGGTTAPAQGTVEAWTVASSAAFPAASTGVSQFRVCDRAAPGEVILVTIVSGVTWTVTRGAEGTTPVPHTPGFTVFQDLTAGALGAFAQLTGAAFTGPVDIAVAGKGLQVAEGSNAKQGTAVLVAGSKVVPNTAVTASSRIFLTSNADGGTPGWLRVSARTAGTSFTITSSSGTDTSTVAYEIFEPG